MHDLWSTTPPTLRDLSALVHPRGVEPSEIAALFEQIKNAYASEGRFYHTLAHVGQVLKGIEYLALAHPLSEDEQLAVRLAAWFHDVVYDPHRNDNEEQSAAWMTQATEPLNLPASVQLTITHLILATRKHEAREDDRAAQLLLDADLAVLGAPREGYAVYAAGIRREYAFVPEAAYRAGRVKVLEGFLDRERIYFTKQFERWEVRARENLLREISDLQNPVF